MNIVKFSLLCLVLASCIACSTSNTALGNNTNSAPTESLYVEMGQQAALDKIVDNLINIIGQDEIIFSHFADSNVSHFRKKLTLFLCQISDGPCQYNGDSMQDIHRGMQINTNQFNHFVELFIAAMDASGIAYPTQNKLLARLAPLRKNIIKI
ncbi:group 1 truncated hemoglobin [Colwellia sp. M166]|uniref:group I truncated hemoglobin n=1 Tax=Colwellia sp. M166 TaxID=2583805 RepID=UPI00211DCF8D|nr:group 1 truncated hemoglobin [Colwellia sp. M166]UUO22080.1 group 1 truncated hemoglobin [Colwellia sp. M166]|tara:strand:+ start:10766 stop:11224 length:459 start_codon:yes stop_codon:yes gene_type:complete